MSLRARWAVTRHLFLVRLEQRVGRLIRRLPKRFKRMVLVDIAVTATTPPMIGPDEYAGPDGLDYKRLWEATA